MKNIKRFLSVCLSLIMLLSSSFVVLADSNETNEAKEANESFVSLDEIAKYEDKMYADSAPNEIVITDPVAIQKLATEQGFPDVEDIKKLTYTIGKVGQSALDDEIPQKEVPEMDAVEEIISKISEDSPYKRRPTQKRTWMTVPEMGKLLGLKKTDRYWLVHKNVFESKEIAGKIRINIASFEKWYANQIKYHKVTGEEPGKELKSWSYSIKEVADLLGVDEYLVYDLLKKNQMEAVIVDYWKRIPKESFQNWYKSQSRYRTKEDRKKDALLEDATITMEQRDLERSMQ